MHATLLAEVRRIQTLPMRELLALWSSLYNGEASRSRNRPFLVKRLCWRVQELAHGGLSDGARSRLEELAPESFTRARVPASPPTLADVAPPPPPPRERSTRDPRLPTPGTVITRRYRDRELRLTVLDDGFELDGVVYGSLSEAARAVTGQHWNGKLFWGVTQRKRKV